MTKDKALCALFQLPRLRARALIAALPAVIKRDMDKLAYRIYVTDILRGLAGGKCARYADWIDGKATPQDNRNGDDIDRELSQKFGWS